MKMNKAGVDLICEFEGFSNKAYKCPAGVWTIAFGHTAAAGLPEVKEGMSVSRAEGLRILKDDLKKYEAGVRDALKVELNPNQFSACVSLAYNIGVGGFRKSSVLRFCNNREWKKAAEAFALWNKAGGRVLPGLIRRRAAEAALFLKDSATEDTEIRPVVDEPKGKPMHLSTTNVAAGAAAAAGITGATKDAIANGREIFAFGNLTFLLCLIILACAAWIIWERYNKARDWDV